MKISTQLTAAIKTLLFGLLVVSLTSCDSEEILSEGEVPEDIQSYMTMHFPNNQILQVTKETEGFNTSYDVKIDGNISLDFNGDKELTAIEGNEELPLSVLPKNLADYVKLNYPNNTITGWEKKGTKQEVTLDNGSELLFAQNGDFLKID